MGNFLICVFQNPLFSKMQISGLIQNGLCIICIKNCIFRNVGTNGSTLVKQYEWYEMTAETYALNYSERSFIEQKSDKKAVLI